MTNNERDQTQSAIDDMLNQRRQIAVIWITADVRKLRPDLNDDQAWAVLQRCRNLRNCNAGVSRTLIRSIARELFPTGDES